MSDDTSSNATDTAGNTTNANPPADPTAILEMQTTLKKMQTDLANAKKEADEFKRKAAELEKAKAEGAGDFKTLWEQERKLREEFEAKYQDTTSAFLQTQKHSAATEALVKAGLMPDAMKILDKETFDELQVEINEGRMKVNGVETLVSKWKQDYPFLFKNERPAPNVNTGGTGGGAAPSAGEITATKLYEIERKHGIRSTEYRQAAEQFFKTKAQKTAAR